MEPLDFAANITVFLPPCDLLEWEEIPDTPGCYVFIAKRAFPYPQGRSRVFYIGQSVNLRHRLYRHKMAIRLAKSQRLLVVYRPITEYSAKFGANVAVTKAQKDPRETEFRLLAAFMEQFRGLPVANSAVNWRKVREHLGKPAEE